jgi:predicted amidophosphoribosyltransferase
MCLECISELSLLTGEICARCGSPRSVPECRRPPTDGGSTLYRGVGRSCSDCKARDMPFTSARSAVAYRRGAVRMLGAWKEGGTSRLAQVAATIIAGVVPRPSSLALTPIPSDRDRVLWRGHDVTRALSQALAREWDIPVAQLLRRANGMARQKGLDAAERQINVATAFHTVMSPPASICLIDDVYTTGATASAAASALHNRTPATRVEVITFARAIRRRA